MNSTELRGASQIFGLDGTPLDLTSLPESQTIRWVMRRKMEVLTAVRCGLLSFDDACKRYGISMEELLSWERAVGQFGPLGLHTLRSRRHNSDSGKGSRGREKEAKQGVLSRKGRAPL
jgi:hypothetical protein